MLRCLLADDEAPARARLRRLLQPFEDAGRLAVVAEAEDGVDALAALDGADTPVDLAFLDIRMPGLDGFDVLDRVAPERRPDVVFTTAYSEHALRAFEANAVDYLVKPVERDRLDDSVARAERRAAGRAGGSGPAPDERLARLLDWMDGQAPGAPMPRPVAYLQRLSVPYRDRLVIVPVEQVLSAEVQDGITRVYAAGENGSGAVRQFLVPHTLEHLEAHLDPSQFQRVHRSALVQVAHIREMVPWFSGRYKLVLTGGHEVIASRERSRALREHLAL